jgi:diacylglycerol kinase
MDTQTEKKVWRSVGHKQRFVNTFRGMYVFWMTTNDLFRYITPLAILVVGFFGFYFEVANFEWLAIVFSVGLVIISEVINTAIEIDVDLTSPGYHPFARDAKDVAAAAVLLSIIISVIVGLVIFLPKILLYVKM